MKNIKSFIPGIFKAYAYKSVCLLKRSENVIRGFRVKYFTILIILIASACGSSKNSSNNSTNAAVRKNTIQIKVNEERTIQFPSRASGRTEMAFTLSDTTVAQVSRKHMISTYDSTALRPGDPVLAVWVIKGLKRGTTTMKIARGRTEKIGDVDLRLKNFRIIVTE